jgi:hypothetical protein
MASAAVIAVSAGVLLGGAGTASAQEPWGKYPTRGTCRTQGVLLVQDHRATQFDCWENTHAPSSERWWLFIV